MGAFMHHDWIIFSGDGNFTTKEEFLESVRSGRLKHTRMYFETLRVNIYGDTGIIVQRGISAGMWDGRAFSNQEFHRRHSYGKQLNGSQYRR